jgi:hypothetical protein
MPKEIKWGNIPMKGEDIAGKLTIQRISQQEKSDNGQGKKNVKSGHMKRIQKKGCSIGGKVSSSKKTSDDMKRISKFGNQANIEKHGVKVKAINLITNEIKYFDSIGLAEKYTNIQSVTITKILRGLQPKTRTGWTFIKDCFS